MFILVFAAIPSFPEIPSGASWVRWRKETCRNFKEKFHCFTNYCQGYFRLVELACENNRFFRRLFKKLEKVSAWAGQYYCLSIIANYVLCFAYRRMWGNVWNICWIWRFQREEASAATSTCQSSKPTFISHFDISMCDHMTVTTNKIRLKHIISSNQDEQCWRWQHFHYLSWL